MTFRTLILAFILLSPGVTAQQVIIPTGKSTFGSGGTFTYTIGQSFCHIESGVNGTVCHGVHQPFEISEPLNSNLPEGLTCMVYPNPARDVLLVRTDINKSRGWQCLLYNNEGKKLLEMEITSGLMKIPMAEFSSSSYVLIIRANGENLKSYKIIKNQQP
jgi:hypothetical protein